MKLLVLLGFLGVLFLGGTAHAEYTVCAIGDSQVEPGSAFVRYLQRELGSEYVVQAHGRRGWSTRQWIRRGDFGTICAESDVVLVSLGGNDVVHGRPWPAIYRNVQILISQIPHGRTRIIFHMIVPRFYPGIPLARDGIHLTPLGAMLYARVVAPNLRMPVDSPNTH